MSEQESGEKKGFAEGFWSKYEIREIVLSEQRRYMWNQDYWRNVVLPLFGLKRDSTVLDVGCGLGYVGRALAEHVSDGKIIGVDLDAKLIEGAKRIVQECKFEAKFVFRVGSALSLPVENDSVDVAVCQCLLMHLDDPLKAIVEMQRVVKHGGRAVAIEPDYAGTSFFDSAFEEMHYSLEDRLRFKRWETIVDIGKKKLGMGDNTIGTKVPRLFHEAGLRVLEVRSLDRTFWLIPPYEHENNELELKHMMISAEEWAETLSVKEHFMAGGGTEEEWKQYMELAKKEHEIRLRQIKERTYIMTNHIAATITIAEKTHYIS